MADDLDPAAVEALDELCRLDDEFGMDPADVRWVREQAQKIRAALAAARDGEAWCEHYAPGATCPVCSPRGAAAPTVTTEQRQAAAMILHTAGVCRSSAVTDQVLDALGVEVREP